MAYQSSTLYLSRVWMRGPIQGRQYCTGHKTYIGTPKCPG